MARKRRPGSPRTTPARPAPAQAVAGAPSLRPRRWMWYVLAISAGLIIAGQLGIIAAGDIADQRDLATYVCLENTRRLRDALSPADALDQAPIQECPAASDRSFAFIIIPFYVGVAGLAFVLSQVVARRVAFWAYQRRVARASRARRG